MKVFFTLLIGLFYVSNTAAQNMQGIQLNKLEVIKTQEKQDELFIHITEFPANSKPKHYYVPQRPAHWLSEHLNKIQNIHLWNKPSTCEATDVLFSLVEEDAEPWDPNDLLGSVMLQIRCENGKMTQTWQVPDPKNTRQISNTPTFLFQQGDAQYKADFSEIPIH